MTGASVALAGRIRRSRARQRRVGSFLLESLGLCGRVLSIVGAPWRVMRELAPEETTRKWVARCTAPGLKWTAQRVDRMGTSWRDQTSHIPLRMRLRLPSINGCRYDCQFPRYISREIAAAGCRKFRPRAPIFAAGRPPSSDPRRSGGIPAPWPRRRAIATGRTGAPSPVPWCRRRDRSGGPGSC